MSNSFRPHGHARLYHPSLSPRTCSNLSWWCHPTISFSVLSFPSCPKSFPSSESFPMNWLFTSCSQSTGASASVLPMNIQDWFPLVLTDFISLLSRGLSRVFQHCNSKALILGDSAFFMVQLSHLNMTIGKAITLIIQTFICHNLCMHSPWPFGLFPVFVFCFFFLSDVTLFWGDLQKACNFHGKA